MSFSKSSVYPFYLKTTYLFLNGVNIPDKFKSICLRSTNSSASVKDVYDINLFSVISYT